MHLDKRDLRTLQFQQIQEIEDSIETQQKMTQCRKNLINKIPPLTYLDDRPVFKDERRTAEEEDTT